MSRKKEVKTMKYRIITLIGLAGSTLAVCFEAGLNSCRHCFVYGNRLVYRRNLLPGVFGKSPKSENGALESRAGWKGLCRKRHDIVVCSHCCPSGCIDGGQNI